MACWMQQWMKLHESGMATPDSRKKFLTNFEDFLDLRLEKGEEIIIGMDTNEPYGKNSNITALCTKLNLAYANHHLHGKDNTLTTYQRGHQQIDFVFATPGLLQGILTA
eukprot:6565998-Ditylum_brightwellii.AAC.1